MTSLLHRLRSGLRAALQVGLRRAAALVAVLGLAVAGLAAAAPAQASSAGRYLSSDSYQELASAIKTTTDKERLADLQVLEQAVASSSDRAQVSNKSSHSVGVFARYKKLPATQPASFYVLGPGHKTDDDFELVGVYVPADVSLGWGSGGVKAGSSPRVARILEGQQLKISDPVLEVSQPEVTAPAATAAATPAAPAAAPAKPGLNFSAPAAKAPAITPAPAPTAAATKAPEAKAAEAVSYELSLPVFAVTAKANGIPELPALTQSQLDLEPETAPVD